MDPDLMRASGVQGGLSQRRSLQAFEHSITRSGFTSGPIIHCHSFAMRAVTRNRGANLTLLALHFPTHYRVINFAYLSQRELRSESQVGLIRLGDDHAAAGLFIKAMDDSRSRYTANAAQGFAAMVQQPVYQRVAFMT